MSELLPLGQQLLAAQAFSRYLGAELTAFSPGAAELSLPIHEEFLQQHGYIHAGVISYLAETALSFAGGSALGPAVLSSEYKINFLRPARGERLIARAAAVAAGQRQAVCRCDLFCVDGRQETLCATAQGTVMNLTATPPPSDQGHLAGF